MGIAMCRGDLFAAVKVNVPAGVRHMLDRCGLMTECKDIHCIPDPPVLVDYSAQNDEWSAGHEQLYRVMRENRYAMLGYWGNFGHSNNDEEIEKVNDLVHSFDIFQVRRNGIYPVFTDADTNDPLPWAQDGSVLNNEAGQLNGFFRWGKAKESETHISIPIWLLSQNEWKSRRKFPKKAKVNVTLRRIQKCRFRPGVKVRWRFGTSSGTTIADEQGLVTVQGIVISTEKVNLILHLEDGEKEISRKARIENVSNNCTDGDYKWTF